MSEMETAESIMSRHKAIQARLWGNLYPAVPRERVFRPVEALQSIMKGTVLYAYPIGPDRAPTTPQEALRVTSRKHGFPVEVILGHSRKKELWVARQEVIQWIDTNRRWSLTQIANFMNRDHTSILHALGGKREIREIYMTEHEKQVEAGAIMLRKHEMKKRKVNPWEVLADCQKKPWLVKSETVLKAALAVVP